MTAQQIFGMDQSVISEENLELAFGGLLEGVCLGYGNECRVTRGAGGIPNVNTGLLAVGGVFINVSSGSLVQPGDPDPLLPMYKRIVAQRDNSTDAVLLYVKHGTPAANPTPPSLTRAGGVYEISLARIYYPAGVPVPTENYYVDERGSPAVCGYMTFKAREQGMRQAIEGMRQRGSWSARASAAAAGAMNASGLYGNFTQADNARAAAQDADGICLQQTTTNAAGNIAYIACLDNVHRRSYGTAWECKFKLSQINEERLFVGLALSGGPTAADNPAGYFAGLQFSTARPDTNFQFMTKDNVTQHLYDSGVPPVALTAYIVRILLDSAFVIFELRDTSRNVLARERVIADLPPTAQPLWVWSALRNLTTVAATKTISQYYAEGINRSI